MAKTSYYSVNGKVIAERTGATRLDYVSDALGSTVTTLDQSRNVVATCRYTPYGQSLGPTGTQPAFGWNGASGYNQAAGVKRASHQVRARIYDDQAGQWTSTDPLWPNQPGYIYGAASPVMQTDPTGQISVIAISGDLDGVHQPSYSFGLGASQVTSFTKIPRKAGYIIQKVVRSKSVSVCNTIYGNITKKVYYEAWKIDAQGNVFSCDGLLPPDFPMDQWSGSSGGGLHVSLKLTGTFVFVPTNLMAGKLTEKKFLEVFRCGNVPEASKCWSTEKGVAEQFMALSPTPAGTQSLTWYMSTCFPRCSFGWEANPDQDYIEGTTNPGCRSVSIN